MKQLNKIKFTDSKNMNVRMLPKRELQKMLKALRDANKQAGKTIFNRIAKNTAFIIQFTLLFILYYMK